ERGPARRARASLLSGHVPIGDRRLPARATRHGEDAHAHRAAEAARGAGSPGLGKGCALRMSRDHAAGNDPFAEYLPAYALGALDPADAARLAAHLPTCPACQAELAGLQAAAAALALSVEPATPRAGHQERFLRKLDAL